MNLFEFLSTQSGADVLRITGNVVSIIGAVLTGAALRNISQLRKMVGGIVRPGPLRRLFNRARHQSAGAVDAVPDAFQSLTIAEKVDMLKDNQEILSLRLGVGNESMTRRLDRVDPPDRRH